MKEKDKEVINVVVNEYPVAGLLRVFGLDYESLYYLLSPTPITTWNYGQVVALVFDCVPSYPTEMELDGEVVYPYKRNVVVGIGSSWHIEYNISKDKILVEEYEIIN